MKQPRLALLLVAAGAGLAAFRQDPPAVAPQAAAAADEHSPLEEQMEIVEDSMRALRRSLRDEAKDAESLARLGEIQAAALACKALPPRMTDRVPEGERAAFLRDYRLEMIRFVEGAFAIEKALLAGDRDAAREAHKTLSDMEDSGHDRFTADE